MIFLINLRYKLSNFSYFIFVLMLRIVLIISFFFIFFFFLNSASFESSVNKLNLFKEALVWEYRAFVYDGVDRTGLLAPHSRLVATIEGMTKDGELLVRYPNSGSFKEEAYGLADLEINDLLKAASYIDKLKLQPIYIDIYKSSSSDVVVVWLNSGEPLNLELLNIGAATPKENPPTNIVNILMAAYLWNQF